MYPLDDTRIHPKQRFVNPFFRVLSHCMDYVPIFVHARQTVGYKKTPLYRFLQKKRTFSICFGERAFYPSFIPAAF